VVQFELTDSAGRSIDSLGFPVNPRSLEVSEDYLNSVTKTAHGVTTYSNQTFNPFQINMSGTYGRSFKTLVVPQTQISDLSSLGALGALGSLASSFHASIKTGYGTTKRLESILKAAQVLDDGNLPRKLYFYCPIFNISNIVKVNQTKFDMTEQTNRMWNYTVGLTAIAPANTSNMNIIKHAKQTSFATIQRGVTAVASEVTGDSGAIADFIIS